MPLNINFQQVLLHMLNFVLLFGAMYFLLYQPVKNFMDSRARRYEKMDEEAKAALAEAEVSKAEYEKKLAAADAEIAQKHALEQAKLAEESAQLRERAQQEADGIIAKAKKSAETEHDKMLRDADREIADLVASAAEKLVLSSTSAAYDQFLATAEERRNDA